MRVERISKSLANAVVASKHYRRTLGIFWEGYGLFDDSDALRGVCCFGQPSPAVQSYAFADRDFRLYELTRLVVDRGVANGASLLISRSLALLSERPAAVISYADGGAGHAGIVYQATNWLYTGAVTAHDSLYEVNGELWHSKTVCDRFGVTAPAKWARENGVRVVKPQAKHRYFTFVGDKRQRRNMRKKLKYAEVTPYPKADKTLYNDGPHSCEVLAQSTQFI